MNEKPLGIKSYGSIPHLPGSRLGPGDHTCHEGQARIATVQARDKHDFIVVQEKVDGSNVSIAKINGQIIPLTRAGWVANSSPYEQHHRFHGWVMRHWEVFYNFLEEGERVCGEWMAQAHGTIYNSLPAPFLAFDIMRGKKRAGWDEFKSRFEATDDIHVVPTIHAGGPISIEYAMLKMGGGWFGAEGGPEGAVWRVFHRGEVDFLVKYVRPDKVDGRYLPEISGCNPVWNWQVTE
jgi:hypothetical protein